MSSMIHSARPTDWVSPVVNIVFAWHLIYFEKWGRTNGRHVQKQWSLPAVTVGRPSGSIAIKLRSVKMLSIKFGTPIVKIIFYCCYTCKRFRHENARAMIPSTKFFKNNFDAIFQNRIRILVSKFCLRVKKIW